ncbi:hypothetical protein DRQ50_10420 [bacterium]|nr:MAG: hypothetical protein DRQ50_10420 [bacterium]
MKSADPTTCFDQNPLECRRKILVAANDLISEIGFDRTTMGMVAEKSGISLKMLTGRFSDKQQILDELVGHHLNILEGIRALTRSDPASSPLQCMKREWKLMCEYMNTYQGTVLAYQQNQPMVATRVQDRIKRLRDQDVELLEKACALRELPRTNTASLEAVLHGTLWTLILESVQEQEYGDFATIPDMLALRVLVPLIHQDRVN